MPPYHTEQLRKLFIGGLSLETTEDDLREYFSRWGNIVDVVVMRFPDTRRSRGFGFVTFENVESVDDVLGIKSHFIDGKQVEPKRAVAKDETRSSSEGTQEKENKVFVGGLASATTEEDIRNCFTTFCNETGQGKIEEVLIMKDPDTGRLRGFGFVTFDCKEIVDKVCSVKYFEIRTKTVEVRRAESRLAMMKKEQRDHHSYSKRKMDDRRRDSRHDEPSRGNFTSGLNQLSMIGQGGGGNGGGFGAGVNMNPMALAGMMSMFFSQMANMGGMAGNLAGNMAGNMAGNLAGNMAGNMAAMNQRSNTDMIGRDRSDTYRATDVSIYGDQAAANVADMSGYSNAMNAVLGAAGMNPGNVQAALYNAYASGGTGTANGTAQLGSYDQSSSTYGPSRSGSGNRGYKPY
ncbi:heterogeneous nuclear ribonucleoprotein A1-like 2 isoform X2 [Xenia sp. Carnegie-2017]|uniref:heterogeneous nuclear ribonucleoprotein A1-like 2 isoform X2 n=1 Tax=Xenia sp. Carnegie-2017 TaxID=2897299 RepID=UPI001F04E085|nr:heterogeneous nuclear ribonucleoprotein A1-like 2 isoform X2 [Xenia sp. Carnegie-2017]